MPRIESVSQACVVMHLPSANTADRKRLASLQSAKETPSSSPGISPHRGIREISAKSLTETFGSATLGCLVRRPHSAVSNQHDLAGAPKSQIDVFLDLLPPNVKFGVLVICVFVFFCAHNYRERVFLLNTCTDTPVMPSPPPPSVLKTYAEGSGIWPGSFEFRWPYSCCANEPGPPPRRSLFSTMHEVLEEHI